MQQLAEEDKPSVWPKDKYHHISFDEKDINETINGVINDWKISRECYPGWYILPSDKRNLLLRKTESCDLAFMFISKNKLEIKNSKQYYH